MRIIQAVALASISFALASCCYLAPCHPASWIVGSVVTAEGAPIAGATVSLFGRSTQTTSSGCFRLSAASALPLSLSVQSTGYSPVQSKARYGYSKVVVMLSKLESSGAGQVQWQVLSEEAFVHSPACT